MASTDTHRDAAATAKLVRQQIRTAVSIGALPDVTYRVRSSRFAGGQAVDITMDMADDRAWVPTQPTDPEFTDYHMDRKLSQEVRDAGRYLATIADVLGHDGRRFFINAYLVGGVCI